MGCYNLKKTFLPCGFRIKKRQRITNCCDSKAKKNSSEYETFITMEKKLMKYIMNPSMIFTWLFGVFLVLNLEIYNQLWLSLKFVLVFLMSIFHMYCAKIRKNFENMENKKDERFFRWINEVPTVLFLIIVFLVVFQPSI